VSAEAVTPGLLGKLPSRGDFVQRGLSPVLVARWQAWLDAAMAAARPALAADWPDIFLTAPVWAFALRDADGPLAGVLVPGTDSVGRCHPLVLAAPLTGGGDGAALARWVADAAELAVDAVTRDLAPDAVAAELTRLDQPAATLRGACLPDPPGALDLAGPLTHAGAGMWWTDGSDAVAAASVVCPAGRPQANAFPAFLDGAWHAREAP